MKRFSAFISASCIVIMHLLTTSCNKNTEDEVNKNTNWSTLGSAFDNEIFNVIAGNDGKVYVSGGDLQHISVWDGKTWSRLGNIEASALTGGVYWPISVDNKGNVYALGFIKVPMANSEYHIAQWNKSTNTWINLTNTSPLFDNGVYAITCDTLGNVYAAGNVIRLNSKQSGNYVYKYHNGTWSSIGGTLTSGVNISLYIDKNGELYGSTGMNAKYSPTVSKWNGTSWQELGGTNSCNFGTGFIKCINADSNGNIYAGGYFTDGIKAYNIYKWTKSTNQWSAIYTFGSSLDVNSIAFDKSDTLYAAGRFINSSNYCYIAKYHISNWSDYGVLNANNTINSICFDTNGNLYAAGAFTNSNNKYYVAIIKKK